MFFLNSKLIFLRHTQGTYPTCKQKFAWATFFLVLWEFHTESSWGIIFWDRRCQGPKRGKRKCSLMLHPRSPWIQGRQRKSKLGGLRAGNFSLGGISSPARIRGQNLKQGSTRCKYLSVWQSFGAPGSKPSGTHDRFALSPKVWRHKAACLPWN